MEAACAAPSTALPHILCQHCPVFPWTLTLGLSALPAGLDSAPDSLCVQLMCHQHCPHCLGPPILGDCSSGMPVSGTGKHPCRLYAVADGSQHHPRK